MLKKLYYFVLLCLILLGCVFLSGCKKAISAPSISPSEMPSPIEYDIEEIILDIDERVLWIDERNGLPYGGEGGEFDCIKDENFFDYYDGESLVYREGAEHYDLIEGAIIYNLYYDDGGRLIYADLALYRGPFYYIYFENDTFIRLAVGEPTNESVQVLNNSMIYAIELCLKNAYIKTPISTDISQKEN